MPRAPVASAKIPDLLTETQEESAMSGRELLHVVEGRFLSSYVFAGTLAAVDMAARCLMAFARACLVIFLR